MSSICHVSEMTAFKSSERPSKVALISSVLLILAMGGLQGCAPFGDDHLLTTECYLPEDQSKTLQGRWPVLPVKLALDTTRYYSSPDSQWTDSEKRAIAAAADVWNRFYVRSRGVSAFDYGGSAETFRYSSGGKPSFPCEASIVDESGFRGNVVIYKETSWPVNGHTTIALTTSCESKDYASGTLKVRINALIEVNFRHYFRSGETPMPDLQSIMAHELGHVFGLGHSCEAGKAGFPHCKDSRISRDYLLALMFPEFKFDGSGRGEQKRFLQLNDQQRANCLYENLGSG